MELLATKYPKTEFIAVSPADGKIANVRNVVATPGPISQFGCRLAHSRFTKWVPAARGIQTSVAYHRALAAMRGLEPLADGQTVILCMTFTAAILARRILAKARIVYWIHSLPRVGQEKMALEAVNAADAVAAPSKAIYMDLFQLLCRNRFTPPVWVIPNCIDEEQFKIVAGRRAETRAKLGLSDDDVAIIHVGRAPEKGLLVVQTAISLCEYRDKKIVLVSVGGQQSGRRRISAHAEVIETGRVSPQELNKVYQACDLGVVASVWWENCPLALIEMMSLGLCTIGSRVGGIPEMICHGENGLLVDAPNDVQAWAATIDMALNDVALRVRLGREARQSVERKFSQAQYIEKWEKLLNIIVAEE
jgi:glycosyltransferase involved in cell wall biosynthesis